jgi:hypothetical protein
MKKILLFCIFATGCGGMQSPTSSPTPPMTPVTQDASVSGQYTVVLTSTSGHGTTNIYSDITQTGKTFTGATNTLVCPSNDLSQCQGEAATAVSIAPSGTVSGANITMMVAFPSTTGADTVTMVGTAMGTSLAGTYTDSLGDAGTWTATPALPPNGTFSGTFNSTANPLPIAPTIIITTSQVTIFNLSGTATITNSPCVSSLTLMGQGIGGALTLTDAAGQVVIIALPTGSSYTFSYKFEPTATNCAGDYGVGMVTNTGMGPFDY